MDTTITGMFSDQRAASIATSALMRRGLRRDQIRVVADDSPDRHRFLEVKTADTRRAAITGMLLGAIGGGLAFGILAEAAIPGWAALVGAVAGAIGGAVLGIVIGRSTGSQIRAELERSVDAGAVLVSVTADKTQQEMVIDLLATEGGTSVVSNMRSFIAKG